MAFNRWGEKITRRMRKNKGWRMHEDESTRKMAVELGKLNNKTLTESDMGDLWDRMGRKQHLVGIMTEWLNRTHYRQGEAWMPKDRVVL